jgi:hypothetical protein
MIPRIQTGSSFKGAGLYYLHDKRADGEEERLTTDRVAWTYAINTLENDPEAVLSEMRRTAFDQPLLKRLSKNRSDGRPTEKTVMTVALAWSPLQTPTKNDMIEAGHSYLQHMGWEAHQVLFVAHNDTKHPHVHLIINRVHPETGMTLDDNWAKIRAQKWALAYERENGHIYCEAREAKYTRAEGRDPNHMSHREWQMWQEISKDNALDPEFHEALKAGEWDALKGHQRDSRIEYWKETGRMCNQLRAALREEVRADFAPEWKAYAREKEERDKKTALYDREARRAIRALRKQTGITRPVHNVRPEGTTVARAADGTTYIRTSAARTSEVGVVRGPDGRTFITRRNIESGGIEQIKERKQAYHARHREELWAMRRDITARQKERLKALAEPALEKLGTDRATAYRDFLAGQRAQKSELRDDQKQGERRHDLLGGYGGAPQPTPLTPEQIAAYVQLARKDAAQAAGFSDANREVTGADRARSSKDAQDPQTTKAAKEVTDRGLEKQDKDRARESNRQADVDFYLKQRAADRARDRGGGRDR